MVLLAAQLTSKGTTLVSLYLLGHALGDAVYGRWAVALALPLSLEALSDMGLSLTLIREGAGRPHVLRRLVADMLPVRLVLGLLLVAGTYVLAVSVGVSHDLVEVAVIVGIAKALDSMTSFVRSVFDAAERMEYEAASLTLDALVRLAFVTYALISDFGLVGLAKALVLSSAVVLVATVAVAARRFLRGIRFRFAPRESLLVLRRSLPLAFVYFFEGLSFRADTVLLGLVLGDSAAGHFSAAARLVEPLLIVPLVLGIAMFPLVSRHAFEGRESTSRLFRIAVHFAVLVALAQVVVLVGLSEPIVSGVFGSGFSEAASTLSILAIALVPLSVRVMLVSVLSALGQQQRLLRLQAIGFVANVAIAIALIRPLGVNGAAIAALIGELLTVGAGIVMIRGVVEVDVRDALRTLIVGAPALATLALLDPLLGAVGATTLSLVVLAVAVRLAGVLRQDELGYIQLVSPRFAWLAGAFVSPARRRL